MDKYKYIKEVLEKYWAGTSSTDEEKALRDFFSREQDIPQALQPYADFFAGQQEDAAMTLSAGFEERLLARLPQQRGRIITYSAFFKIAALFVIAIGSLFFGYQYAEKQQAQAQAHETLIEALSMITENMQQGENMMDEGLKQFEILKSIENQD